MVPVEKQGERQRHAQASFSPTGAGSGPGLVAERHSAEFDAPARLSCVSVDAVPKVRRGNWGADDVRWRGEI